MGQQEAGLSTTVGLIGGLAARAGIYYYERILERQAQTGTPAGIMLNHADVGRVLAAVGAGDKQGLGAYLGALANALFDGGASFVAISAVAPHMAIEAITCAARGPVVNVLDVLDSGISDAGVKRVAVFGNRTVMQTNVFGAVRPGMVVELLATEIEAIHAAYTDIALRGKRGTDAETELLRRLAGDLMNRGAEAIVLAGTDLSSFYADNKPDFPHIDVAQLHIEAIMARASARP